MKNEESFEKFVISQVAIMIQDDKCLILEFSQNPGRWGLPGGRLDRGEVREPAFRREIKEELGITDFDIVGVVDYDIWHTSTGVPVCGVVNLIDNYNVDEIELSQEHLQVKWITRKEIDDYDFVWPFAKRMIEKGFDYLKK